LAAAISCWAVALLHHESIADTLADTVADTIADTIAFQHSRHA
jgi:hypothetical protein